ncbi:metal-dependent hydrolase [Halorubrum sp. HHNYT27]|uniref:metal-dependent hydrolase n=1 Tax=Halorubrum sp. HHNYT27 TaxID=3402275 RepID=UPI003EBD974F
MLFPTHLLVAVGIGWLADHPRVRRQMRLPSRDASDRTSVAVPTLSTGWLVAGAALPDAVDKPLGLLGVFDVYQSIGHSALLAPLAAVVAITHRHGLAVAVGWGSHLALDAFHVVVNGRASDALFLAWPVVERPDPLAIPPGEFALYYAGSTSYYIELLLWLTAVIMVVRSRLGAGAAQKNGR